MCNICAIFSNRLVGHPPFQVDFIHGIVAHQHRHCLVPGDRHDRSVLLAGSSHVGDEGMPKVMKPEVLNPGQLASSLERTFHRVIGKSWSHPNVARARLMQAKEGTFY